MSKYHHLPRIRVGLALMATVGVTILAGCGGSSSHSSSGTTPASGTSATSSSGTTPAAGAASTSSCGSKPGVKATGSPINIGTIDTHQPGTPPTLAAA